MSTYTQIVYQVVFATKYREKTMVRNGHPEFFKYIAGLLKNKNCKLHRINGVEDHLHIIVSLHPSVSLASLVKDIKLSTTKLIREKNLFPGFRAWQTGYAAFIYTRGALPNLIEYVKNQEAHHGVQSFEEEYMALLAEHKIEYDEKYLFAE
jgi:putative transposase